MSVLRVGLSSAFVNDGYKIAPSRCLACQHRKRVIAAATRPDSKEAAPPPRKKSKFDFSSPAAGKSKPAEPKPSILEPIRWYSSLDFQQKIYTGILGLVVLILVPRALLVGFVGAERVAVASIGALERLIFGVLSRLTVIGTAIAVAFSLGWGIWLFIRPSKK